MWALLLGLSGCTFRDACDTATEDCLSATAGEKYDGEVAIEQVGWGCCAAGEVGRCAAAGEYWYDVVTRGRMGKATLSVRDAGPSAWTEQHNLPRIGFDPYGWWEDRYLELTIADTGACEQLSECASDWEAGRNTLFPCAAEWTDGRMTFWLRVYDPGGRLVRCVGWGRDPEAQLGCTRWEGG